MGSPLVAKFTEYSVAVIFLSEKIISVLGIWAWVLGIWVWVSWYKSLVFSQLYFVVITFIRSPFYLSNVVFLMFLVLMSYKNKRFICVLVWVLHWKAWLYAGDAYNFCFVCYFNIISILVEEGWELFFQKWILKSAILIVFFSYEKLACKKEMYLL